MVMLTVTSGLESSGKSRTRRPLGSLYSVMPSTVATFFGTASAERAGAPITTAATRATARRGDCVLRDGNIMLDHSWGEVQIKRRRYPDESRRNGEGAAPVAQPATGSKPQAGSLCYGVPSGRAHASALTQSGTS